MEFSAGLREVRSVSHRSSYADADASYIPEHQCQQEKEANYYIKFNLLNMNPDKHANFIVLLVYKECCF